MTSISDYLSSLLSGGSHSIAGAPGAPIATIAPQALPYDLQIEQAKRQQALAEGMQQETGNAIPIQSYKGIQAPIPWTAVLAKALQGAAGGMRESAAVNAQKEAAAADQARATAGIDELSAHAGAPSIAPTSMQINATAPQLPGGPQPVQNMVTAQMPGEQGTGPTQSAPYPQQQMATLARLAAQGGPATNAVTGLYAPMVAAQQQADLAANQPLSRAAREQAQLTSDLSLRNTTAIHELPPTAYELAQIKHSGLTLAEQRRHNMAEEAAARNPWGMGVNTQLTGKDFLASIAAKNPGVANQIRQIGTYRQPAPAGRFSKDGEKFMAMVSQAYPNYDVSLYNKRNAAVAAYGMGGKQGQQLLATSNAISHMELLRQVSDALQNGDTQFLNSARNTFRTAFGSELPTNQRLVADIAGRELAKAIVPGGGGTNEREDFVANFKDQASKGQYTGAIKYGQGLLAGQLKNSKQRYEHDTGNDDFEQMVSPEAVDVMKNFQSPSGGGGGGGGGNLSAADQEALAWANANPKDPRANAIKTRLKR